MHDTVANRARVRIRFSKLGKVRFTSHRDTARTWERALRRAELPVAYTEGFSPRPRVSFGFALSTGHESLGEYLDVDLDLSCSPAELDVAALPARLDPALPAGVAVQGAAVVEPGTPSLQEAVTACRWRLEVVGADPGEVGAVVEQLLDDDQLVVTRARKGRGNPTGTDTLDLRPALLDLAPLGPTPSGTELVAELATQPRALRPGEVVAALCAGLPGAIAGRVCRTHQFLGADRREPLASPPGLDGWSLAATAGPVPDHMEGLSDVRRTHHAPREGVGAGL
jgi:radical SAM-linked protein